MHFLAILTLLNFDKKFQTRTGSVGVYSYNYLYFFKIALKCRGVLKVEFVETQLIFMPNNAVSLFN